MAKRRVFTAKDVNPFGQLVGTNGGDLLIGGPKVRQIQGKGGDDILRGSNRVDLLQGGAGNDTLFGGGGNDRLQGGAGRDRLFGGDGTDELLMRNPGTIARGQDGNDRLLIYNANQIVIDGGRGNDFYLLAVDGPVNIVDVQGNDTVQADRILQFTLPSGIENLRVSRIDQPGSYTGNDGNNNLNGFQDRTGFFQVVWRVELFGEGGNDLLRGDIAPDLLDGGEGDDALFGSEGLDTLNGGAGRDYMAGGSEDDTYYVDDVGDDVVESSGTSAGNDIVFSVISYTLSANVERLTLSGAEDIDASGNVLDNTITGNDGTNVIAGGGGNDLLTGGLGADIFAYASVSESGPSAVGATDEITDLQGSAGDRIDISAIDADPVATGDQPFTWLGLLSSAATPFTVDPQSGQVGYVFNAGSRYVVLNLDTDAESEMAIEVRGSGAIDATWITL
ncbi:MAG: calcium-binding protein [Hyphomicrobiaceae bacterium]|nr:calcium-binding protein [Hyphomicrobiaceae bacterium]